MTLERFIPRPAELPLPQHQKRSRSLNPRTYLEIRMLQLNGASDVQIMKELSMGTEELASALDAIRMRKPAYKTAEGRKRNLARDQRIVSLFSSGNTPVEIGEVVGLTHERVTEILVDAGALDRIRPGGKDRIRREASIIELRNTTNLTNAQIAERIGVTEDVVTYVASQLIKAGLIESRSNADDALIIQMRGWGKTAVEIAERIGTSPGAVRQRISRLIKSGQLERKS